MLSKAVRVQNKSLLSISKATLAAPSRTRPTIFHQALDIVDTKTTAFSVAKADPTQPLAGHKPLYTNELQAEYNVTDLSNGFTVLTESQTFPGAVHMGKSGCDSLGLLVRPLGRES
mmetsp:Transcript_43646/g.57835  ORF Transcript_43646/g.57835 Transcript_43646/m.57835 type:complete len:116 (+) Transcript_43646:182-529(+)